jgi:hypothetical protein
MDVDWRQKLKYISHTKILGELIASPAKINRGEDRFAFAGGNKVESLFEKISFLGYSRIAADGKMVTG